MYKSQQISHVYLQSSISHCPFVVSNSHFSSCPIHSDASSSSDYTHSSPYHFAHLTILAHSFTSINTRRKWIISQLSRAGSAGNAKRAPCPLSSTSTACTAIARKTPSLQSINSHHLRNASGCRLRGVGAPRSSGSSACLSRSITRSTDPHAAHRKHLLDPKTNLYTPSARHFLF